MKGDVNMSIKLIPNNEEKQKRYVSITKANLNNNESQQKNSIIPSKTLVINELNVVIKAIFSIYTSSFTQRSLTLVIITLTHQQNK